MKILVTGAKGFIGKNLIAELKNRNYQEIYEYDKENDESDLDKFCTDCDFVFHLAGINRPQKEEEFMFGNCNFTKHLLDTLKKHNNICPILVSSSIQAELNNPYGLSKKKEEDLVFNYAKEIGNKVYIYRLPNVYGKWCQPNYNSVVATFCHNIVRDLPIKVDNPDAVIRLAYIDDVFNEFILAMEGQGNKVGMYYNVPTEDKTTVGYLAQLIASFKRIRNQFEIPSFNNHLEKCLYSTFISYLPIDAFSYEAKKHEDERGSFTEIIRSKESGQVSVNFIRPQATKGNHWHHTKIEKFMVLSGHCLIKFRKAGASEVFVYDVMGDKPQIVDIPCGYIHSITNIGKQNAIVFMWCNENYDPQKPDTFYAEVEKYE